MNTVHSYITKMKLNNEIILPVGLFCGSVLFSIYKYS